MHTKATHPPDREKIEPESAIKTATRRARLLSTSLACLLLPAAVLAQLPSPTYGWNLGNTLESTWGYPDPTQTLINSVADAGFNTVRVPCAWDFNANPSNYQISPAYMAQVKQVVDWCFARNLTVIINCHWDGGWLEKHITDAVDPTINAKMQSYWTQIANAFAGYDNRLLFAGANEPHCETPAQWNTLRTYYNTFISAVRATGGNNTSRWLVFSGPATDIDKTDQLVTTLPTDSTPGRLVAEVHYYAPYEWALMNEDEDWGNPDIGKRFYFWGQGYHHTTRTDRNAYWGEEDYVEAQFNKMKTRFVDQGIPVLIGEFQAKKRTGLPDLTGADFDLHAASVSYFYKFFVAAANSRGLKPVLWSTPSGLFDWSTGALLDQSVSRALTGGAALPPPGGGGVIPNGIYKIVARHSGKALEVAGLGRNNGANVQQWGYWWGESQRWMVTHLGNNQYSIIGAQSDKALDVAGWNTNNQTNVQIWTYGGGDNQKWTVTATGGGYYRLTPTHAPNMCLDVSSASPADEANVQIWTYFGGDNQQWAFQAP
jgi:endoglucanase